MKGESTGMLLTGQNGSTLINNTTARTGKWRRMIVLVTAAVTMTYNGVLQSSITIPAGVDFYGDITTVTLGSGTVIVYV